MRMGRRGGVRGCRVVLIVAVVVAVDVELFVAVVVMWMKDVSKME